jgi:hypothetical protein
MSIANTVRSYLERHEISYEILEHPHSQTSEQTADAAFIWEDQLAKTVLLEDDGGYVMAVVPASHRLDLAKLQGQLQRPLHLAKENELGPLFPDCELGAMCGWLDQQNTGVCLALCGGSPVAPSCEGAQPPAICQPCSDCPSLCIPTCDPLADECGPGYACAPNAGNFTCTPAENLGAGTLGDPCEYAIQCAAGFACIDGAAVEGCDQAGCCSPFCSLELPECPNLMSCEPWFEGPRTPPVPDVGVCKG